MEDGKITRLEVIDQYTKALQQLFESEGLGIDKAKQK